MRYNKDNPQWKFSEDQFISAEEESRIIGEYNELCKEVLTTDIREMNEKLYGIKTPGELTEAQERKKKLGTIAGIAGVIIFIGMVLCLIFKQLVIFGYLACFVFLFAGISLLITGKGEIVESSSKAQKNRVMGLFISVAAVLLILMIFFRNSFSEGEFFVNLFVVTFGISGAALLVLTFLNAFSGKLIYKLEVPATCAGYVRSVSKSSGEHRTYTFINVSPLFRYSVGGVQYESIYDDLIAKKDSDVAMGETKIIKVDPRHPENIQSPAALHPGFLIFEGFLGVAFTVIAVGLGMYVTSGLASDRTVETSWAPLINQINGETEATAETSETLVTITDDIINEYCASRGMNGAEWYVEICTVASVTRQDDGVTVYFTDEDFRSAKYAEDGFPAEGSTIYLFYTVDRDYLDSGYDGYKKVFLFADTAQGEYAGDHGAFVEGE